MQQQQQQQQQQLPAQHPAGDGRVPTPTHGFPVNMTKGSMMVDDCRVTSSLAFHPSDPYLPPCRVCGEKASGFHYGVNTCEACKGFFRRSLTRKDQYKCSANQNCEILPGKRTSCPYCRFQKCMSVGMSKDAIKTGRYTLEKRTKNIEEVKKLISKQRREEKQAQDALLFDPELRARQLDHIIEQITAVHLAQSHIPEGFVESVPEKEKHYLEQRALQERMFGPMKPISREDYFRIYKETGIDIDGRREMVTNMVPAIEKSIKKLIVFAKVLPGFKELPINDQIALIKDCRFEVWMLAGHKAINPGEKLYTNVHGVTIHRDDLMKINDEDFVSEFFRAAGLLRKLNLNDTDIALLKGITLLSRDRVALKNPDSVEVSQHVILDALDYHLKKTRPREPFAFPHFILCLAELRTLVHTHAKAEEKMTLEWSDIKYPPLLLEMWSTNTDTHQPD